MSNYIKFLDEASKPLRIVLAVFCIFSLLYRLFKVIIDKAQDTKKLVFLILSVIPIVGTVIWVFDIIHVAKGDLLPTEFGEMFLKKAE